MKILNTWEAPRLTYGDIIALIVATVVPGFVRAWDYSTGDDDAAYLSLVENAFPLNVWGAVLVVIMSSIVFGVFFKIHLLVWLGHSLAALIYAVLFVGVAVQILVNAPPWDGIRFAGVLFTPLTVHVILAMRTGPRPVDIKASVPVETVVKEDG